MSVNTEDELFTLNPWNEKNILLKKEDIYNFFRKVGIQNPESFLKINDLSIYQTAFVHSSYLKNDQNPITENTNNCIELFEKDYEDLEFLGDRCIELAAAFYLYRKYPDTDQGFKTKMKTKLVKKEMLAVFADFLGFQKFMIISKHIEEKTNMGRNNPRFLEDMMEAFICAIFLDQNQNIEKNSVISKISRPIGPGWYIVNHFIEHLFEQCVDFEELVMTEENFKEVLLQYYQKEFKMTPQYMQINVEGPPHERIFTMGVLNKQGQIIAEGKGNCKKKAEQEASKNALKYFNDI